MMIFRKFPAMLIVEHKDVEYMDKHGDEDGLPLKLRGRRFEYVYVPEHFFNRMSKNVYMFSYALTNRDVDKIIPYTEKEYNENFACHKRVAIRGHSRADVFIV